MTINMIEVFIKEISKSEPSTKSFGRNLLQKPSKND